MQAMISQPLSRNEDKEDAGTSGNENRKAKDRHGSLVQEAAHIWLTNFGEAHERVLAITCKGNDGVEVVLMGAESVYANREGKDKLQTCKFILGGSVVR